MTSTSTLPEFSDVEPLTVNEDKTDKFDAEALLRLQQEEADERMEALRKQREYELTISAIEKDNAKIREKTEKKIKRRKLLFVLATCAGAVCLCFLLAKFWNLGFFGG